MSELTALINLSPHLAELAVELNGIWVLIAPGDEPEGVIRGVWEMRLSDGDPARLIKVRNPIHSREGCLFLNHLGI